jgi:hypothetical protein
LLGVVECHHSVQMKQNTQKAIRHKLCIHHLDLGGNASTHIL